MPNQKFFVFLTTMTLVLSGCASGKFKARQEQREKSAAATGMYCDFISGEVFADLDVELSMQMANRCDANKHFSVTNYKNSSDQIGVIYCCNSIVKAEKKEIPKSTPAAKPTETKAPEAAAQ